MRAKSPSAMTFKSGEQEQNINVGDIVIGTQVLNVHLLVVINNLVNPKGPILTIAPRPAAKYHEASMSNVKPSDLKYTQPVWCPPGLTKTRKRKLQWLTNHEKVEREAHRLKPRAS